MHHPKVIDNATQDGRFQPGNALVGQPATRVTAAWLNDVLDNILAVCSAGGVTITDGRAEDLLDSINALIKSQSAGVSETLINILINKLKDKLGGERLLEFFAIDGPASGNWVAPVGATRAIIQIHGAGGGGHADPATPNTGGAGGGGGFLKAMMPVVAGQIVPYNLAAGGAGGVAPLAASGGDDSWFGGLIVGGGTAGGVSGMSGQGGTYALGGLKGFGIAGQAGDDLAYIGGQVAARGGDSPCGGPGGTAGSSPGIDGIAPGGGGGALHVLGDLFWTRAGNGAPGRLIIEVWGYGSAIPGGGVTTDPMSPLGQILITEGVGISVRDLIMDRLGWDGISAVNVTLVVVGTAIIGSSDVAVPAMAIRSGDFPGGGQIDLEYAVGATLIGRGGRGGDGGLGGALPGSGQRGGDTLLVESNPGLIVRLRNRGLIAAPGGGGGGGQSEPQTDEQRGGCGGSGGAGFGAGGLYGGFVGSRGGMPAPGAGYTFDPDQSGYAWVGEKPGGFDGAAGDLLTGGKRARYTGASSSTSGNVVPPYTATPPWGWSGGNNDQGRGSAHGAGGWGGDAGQPGEAGHANNVDSPANQYRAAGGAAGRAIVGIANITVIELGTVIGEVV